MGAKETKVGARVGARVGAKLRARARVGARAVVKMRAGGVGKSSSSPPGFDFGCWLAVRIRAGAGATFEWCFVAQHLLGIGFPAQRECEILLFEPLYRMPHRFVRHLKLRALRLALLCAANRRLVRPSRAREQWRLRSALGLTLHELEQPLLQRAARRGAGCRVGCRVGAGWVQGGCRVGVRGVQRCGEGCTG